MKIFGLLARVFSGRFTILKKCETGGDEGLFRGLFVSSKIYFRPLRQLEIIQRFSNQSSTDHTS